MKKRITSILLCCSIVFAFTACGSKSDTVTETQVSETTTETVSETETEAVSNDKDLPGGNYSEMGEGSVYIACASGTSEDGNIPVIYTEPDQVLIQIGLNAFDFNGAALSFIYIDSIETSKEQLANSQISLNLQDKQLEVGIHKVEVVQYTDDDPASDMITYKTMSYEIKAK